MRLSSHVHVPSLASLIAGAFVCVVVAAVGAAAQETLPWQTNGQDYGRAPQPYPAQGRSAYDGGTLAQAPDPYSPQQSYPSQPPPQPDYRYPPSSGPAPYGEPPPRGRYEPYDPRYGERPEPRRYPDASDEYPPRQRYGANDQYDRRGRMEASPSLPSDERTYSENEVVDAGHRFFGSLSRGLAKAIEWTFKRAGRPNGYILGEDAGGAFIAGLRYGEGRLYTKYEGSRRVFWQGPSIGYDFGGEGSRTMVLVYNLRSPEDIYRRFAGVQGAAYLVGGVGVQLLKADDVTVAPIRTGVGLRLGANIGYLKYTRRPTWNPF